MCCLLANLGGCLIEQEAKWGREIVGNSTREKMHDDIEKIENSTFHTSTVHAARLTMCGRHFTSRRIGCDNSHYRLSKTQKFTFNAIQEYLFGFRTNFIIYHIYQ